MLNIIITVDRIEGDMAICLDDDGREYDIFRRSIGFEVAEGDILTVTFEKNEKLKSQRKSNIDNMFNKLKNKDRF